MRVPRLGLLFASVALGVLLNTAFAGVTIDQPTDGTTLVADTCPVAPCTAEFEFIVAVTGAPVQRVDLEFTPDTGVGFVQPLCTPADPIEQIPGCPDLPTTLTNPIRLGEGSWTVVARVERTSGSEASAPIRLTVLPPTATLPGTITLSSVVATSGEPKLVVAEKSNTPSTVRITGKNLHEVYSQGPVDDPDDPSTTPFLEVFVAPIPTGESTLTQSSGLPVADWCMFKATITGSGPAAEGKSFVDVQLPQLPHQASTLCGAAPGPKGSVFNISWRWVVRDRWIRPERVHSHWAIPSPRAGVAWQDAPAFTMLEPAYPLVDGFGFENYATDPRYYEFLTVYGNNAYICVGALGVCATRVPNPLYHALWWPVYYLAVGSTGGSCNGLSATSLLMAREELQVQDFAAELLFPAEVTAGGDPATYKDSNVCTPVCSPPKPDNLWAYIRMNHGAQISREFLFEMIDTLGEAIFDPDDLSTFKGVPDATLARVKDDPQGYVLCFFKPGNGHCVTPYRVEGDKIFVYDNNAPGDSSRFIEIKDGGYSYPARSDEPNKGKAIMAFPIEIWQESRNLLGLTEFDTLINGNLVEFLYMIAVGSADMNVSNDAGGRWGWEEDGSFTDAMLGAVAVAPLGPQDEDVRATPLLVAMNQPAPSIEINADGGRYVYHAGEGGHLFQLEASDAAEGDKDQIQLGYQEEELSAFSFTPERDSSHFVPRVGLAIGEQESALFHWLGLAVRGAERVGFVADKEGKAVGYRNETQAVTRHILALDYVAGQAARAGRMLYGPFDVPAGASQRIVLTNWPEVLDVVSELDLDGDGTPDRTETVTGYPADAPLDPSRSSDLTLEKSGVPGEAQGQRVAYTLTVTNAGPDTATSVKLVDVFPSDVTLSSVTTTRGTCKVDGELACELGDMQLSESARITYTATLSTPGPLTNGATVWSEVGDPDLTNNSALTAVGETSTGKLSVSAGTENPLGAVTVSAQTGDLPAVQIHVATGTEDLEVKRVAVNFVNQSGDIAPVDTLRAKVIHDANGNGLPDKNEVLVSQSEVSGMPESLMLEFTSPFTLGAESSADFLITLDINDSGATKNLIPVAGNANNAGWRWLMGVVAMVALLPFRLLFRCGLRRAVFLLICLSLSAAVSGCSSNSSFKFTVSVPVNGVTAGSISGDFFGPSTQIRGASITVTK